MEVSVIGCSQAKIGKTELAYRELGCFDPKGVSKAFSAKSRVCFSPSTRWRKAGIRFTLRAVQSEAVRSEKVAASSRISRSRDGVRLFVGLPLDSVSDCNTVNHARAIAAGLKALKLLGVEGVELPVWWGIVEKEAMGKYEWSGYLALAKMVQDAGLKLHVSLSFHASKRPKIPLPEWVSRIGESNPNIFFTDRAGQHYKECLSLAVDDLPVLDGRTPIQVYHEFCESFKSSFSPFMGSTLTGISMGLGPDGELRYPSHHMLTKSKQIPGVGEFQCYDKNMLGILKQHAEATGNPLWGLGGPHDVPTYDQSPNSNNFFRDNGGSWDSPYGDFFLSWYSNQLISHGNLLLSLAASTFSESAATVCGKIPLMHSWYKTRSHPSELTAGYYNTTTRDGYEVVAEMFARNSCKMILPGMDLSDEHQSRASLSSPELLLADIKKACRKHGVEVCGQNSSASMAPGGFQQIKKNLLGENIVDLFSYQSESLTSNTPSMSDAFTIMPSRPSPPPHNHHRHHHHSFLLPLLLPIILTLLLILLLTLLLLLYRKLSLNRTTPSDNHQRRFSYSLLRRSTSSFSSSTLLGHGGFGSVYKATLPSGQFLALKLMDSPGSLQGQREFHNELSIASAFHSPHILSLLGFSSDRRRHKLILVYEYMPNRSLQDALLDKKCPELMEWKKRFDIVSDIAKGLAYLHHSCEPPVIHGDIKPSNILLDADFNAKIGDFGLARLKTEDLVEKREGGGVEAGEDNGSILEETESVTTGFDEAGGLPVDRSPESCVIRILDSEASPENAAVSPEAGIDKASASEGCFDKLSVDSGKDLTGNGRKNGGSKRDWWWKQDNGGGSESGRVKDYVMEWIGSEIKKERPKSEWIASPSSAENDGLGLKTEQKQKQKQKKKQRKRLEWWASLDEERMTRRKEKNRKPREWWKEEFCEELSKKTKKKKRALGSSSGRELWWQKDDDDDDVVEDVVQQERKKRKSSRGSIDWWLDGLSGELRSGRRHSQDWGNGADIPKSGGISSTPSMRGTVCYIAPEYGGGGMLSEKCDVYSFGVLLLVIVSGRRPLQVTASPMSEFERANLISWSRQLARNGKLLDLIDLSIHSLDKEQALLCITIALLCLQKSPVKRPTMKDIVLMLTGEAEPPHLPFEFSPSPPSNFRFKTHKKAR